MAIKSTLNLAKDGRGERIRTSDPIVPNDVRYQAAPLPDSLILNSFFVCLILQNVPTGPSFLFKWANFSP